MASTNDNQRIIIVGAGLAGALMACLLGRRGHRVDMYERRPDPREAGFIGGRSINLALSTRGIDALKRVGLADAVLRDAIPMRGRMMHDSHGRLTFQPYSKNPADAINSISRGGLNLALLEAAASLPEVTLHFGYRCEDVDLERPAMTFEHAETGDLVTVEGSLIIGADGAFSAVRGRMQKSDRFDYSQSYLEHGYKELTIPPTDSGAFAMDPNALHIWPRGGFMMIALPNRDRTFTCTCFWPFEGPNGFTAIGSDQDVRAFFERNFPDAVPLMPNLVEDFMGNPTSSLVTVRCRPWHHEDKVVLIGDSAHAIVPFYGQGMNAAFEDCVVFDECVERYDGDWSRILAAFTELRKENADAIADLALENFIEMRDKVGSRSFLLKKKVEKSLHRALPRWFTPLYNMVTFTTIPYAEARRRARIQRRMVLAGALGTMAVILMAIVLVIWLL